MDTAEACAAILLNAATVDLLLIIQQTAFLKLNVSIVTNTIKPKTNPALNTGMNWRFSPFNLNLVSKSQAKLALDREKPNFRTMNCIVS